MVIRSICQIDYPKTLTRGKNPQPANQSCCVLAALQMIIEAMTQTTYLETEFYNRLLQAGIIRDDGYINSYDDALRLMIVSRPEFITQPNVQAAIAQGMKRWRFFEPDPDAIPLPAIAYLGKSEKYPRGHAVLAVRAAVAKGGGVDLSVIDPKFRNEKARYVMPFSEVKRLGTFV